MTHMVPEQDSPANAMVVWFITDRIQLPSPWPMMMLGYYEGIEFLQDVASYSCQGILVCMLERIKLKLLIEYRIPSWIPD